MRKVIPGEQARSGRALSGAIVANGFVFVSGQTHVQGADIEAQTRGALDKIVTLLTEAGSDTSHAVRCTVFISDNKFRDRVNAVYATYFPVDPPARAVIVMGGGPDSKALVEIDCTAVLP